MASATKTAAATQPRFSDAQNDQRAAEEDDQPTAASHPDYPGLTCELQTITPEMAEEWLRDCNIGNRTLRERRADSIGRDIMTQNWMINGATIVFDWDNVLRDGQHRLEAISESGLAVPSFVVRGIDPEAQKVIDAGAARTVADKLKMQKFPNQVMAASLARWIYSYAILQERGMPGASKSPSHMEIITTAEQFKGSISEAIRFTAHTRKLYPGMSKLKPAVVAMGHWLFTQISQQTGPIFMERIMDGAQQEPESAIMAYRTRIQSEDMMARIEQWAFLVQAWTAFQDQRTVLRFQRPRNGKWNATNMPEPAYLQKAKFNNGIYE